MSANSSSNARPLSFHKTRLELVDVELEALHRQLNSITTRILHVKRDRDLLARAIDFATASGFASFDLDKMKRRFEKEKG